MDYIFFAFLLVSGREATSLKGPNLAHQHSLLRKISENVFTLPIKGSIIILWEKF